ncbi:uncharacterized protein BJ212DRAFT_1544182 [Suillus subaureus]|uniref:Uncharacterized protein n=1 Tax=Suillus subaureus TaxID=48587 RepID=A0A9P7DXB1_9AGAM|nr:uncharacterized protein BJ212DRAFT_1544182 [Suillus subaureus]KAG1805224.1 hypothetical protein BJ212DRAFT_1544182 [Suillus subaureus]
MPRSTPRRQAIQAVYDAYVLNLITQTQSTINHELYGSSNGSNSDHSSSSDTDENLEITNATGQVFLQLASDLYSQRYLTDQININKSGQDLTLLLTDWKLNHPEIFCSYVRMSPESFNALLAAIQDDPIFQNNLQNTQDPIDRQLAVALFRFGHYGNAATVTKVALWAGIGYGTVRLYTNRIMIAVCWDHF